MAVAKRLALLYSHLLLISEIHMPDPPPGRSYQALKSLLKRHLLQDWFIKSPMPLSYSYSTYTYSAPLHRARLVSSRIDPLNALRRVLHGRLSQLDWFNPHQNMLIMPAGGLNLHLCYPCLPRQSPTKRTTSAWRVLTGTRIWPLNQQDLNHRPCKWYPNHEYWLPPHSCLINSIQHIPKQRSFCRIFAFTPFRLSILAELESCFW